MESLWWAPATWRKRSTKTRLCCWRCAEATTTCSSTLSLTSSCSDTIQLSLKTLILSWPKGCLTVHPSTKQGPLLQAERNLTLSFCNLGQILHERHFITAHSLWSRFEAEKDFVLPYCILEKKTKLVIFYSQSTMSPQWYFKLGNFFLSWNFSKIFIIISNKYYTYTEPPHK